MNGQTHRHTDEQSDVYVARVTRNGQNVSVQHFIHSDCAVEPPVSKRLLYKFFGERTNVICRRSSQVITTIVMSTILYYTWKLFGLDIDFQQWQITSVVCKIIKLLVKT